MPTSSDFLRRKTSVPSELRTREWGRVDAWARERAFFMASVDRADILDEFRQQAQAIVDGRIDLSTGREMIRRHLEKTGYKAEPGLEGTIKDLSTQRRRDITLETNVAMARGWAQRVQFAGDITMPGLMLYRAKPRKTHRNWAARCAQFAGRDDVVLTGNDDAPMVALSCSPVWRMLSRFGADYPPFDFGSGMGTRPVPYDECRRMGLITDENEAELLGRVDADQPESMNANLEVERDYRQQDLKDSLSESLGGLAEWRDNKLVFTDPNGSRPYDWREVGRVVSAPLPDGMPNYQATAFRDWLENHDQFEDPTSSSKPHDARVGLDEREDLIRLFKRINPVGDQDGPIYRGLSFGTASERDALLDRWDKQGYSPRPNKIADSWTGSEAIARAYSEDGRSNYGVILRSTSYKSRRRLDDLYRSVVPDYTGPNPKHPIRTEGESVFLGGKKFRCTNFEQKGNIVYVDAEEV